MRLLFGVSLLILPFRPTSGQNGPVYASDASRQVVERMVAAHGGLAKWRAAPTVAWDNAFFNPGTPAGQNPWWITREIVHKATLQTRHVWPLDGATLSSDGETVWTTGWRQANQPRFMAYFFYYFLNLPWLTQEAGTRIGPPGPATLPGRSEALDTVRVTFDMVRLPGRTTRDFFVLYVERETGLLRGYQYGIGYGAMLDLMQLPPEREVLGPVFRIHDRFTTVDGLVFPALMHTGNQDGTRTVGYHALFNYSLTDRWDEAWMRRPPGAVVDTSRAERATRTP